MKDVSLEKHLNIHRSGDRDVNLALRLYIQRVGENARPHFPTQELPVYVHIGRPKCPSSGFSFSGHPVDVKNVLHIDIHFL